MRALLSVFFGLAIACHASSIFTVTFSPSQLVGAPGDMLDFFGTIDNNDGINTEFINSDSFTLQGSIPLDDSFFLANAPLSLAPSSSSGSFIFFRVTIPTNQAAGDYLGAFDVIGGIDAGAQDLLGTVSFTVSVGTAAPEPSAFGSTMIGFVSLLALSQWKQLRRVVTRMTSRPIRSWPV